MGQRLVRNRLLRVAALFACALAGAAAGAEGATPSDLVLILDASGSMWGQIGGENKIVIARRVLGELVDGLPDGRRVALVAYGHRSEGDCEDIELVAPLAPLDREALKTTVGKLNPKGKTPITASITRAIEIVSSAGRGATVVLLSDGLETCGGDPCATVRAAKERGVEFVMHVIGFDVAEEDVSQLECAAQAGGGLFLGAGDAEQLRAALDAAVAMPPDVPAGRLSVRAVADGDLWDASVRVTDAATGRPAGGGRTYKAATTNPRLIPLPAGKYDVEVTAVGLKGDVRRRFAVEIAGDETVEREVDYSRGEIAIGVRRNGELSDAVYKVYVAGTKDEVASGRTYTSSEHNPARVEITAGEYDVAVASVEVAGRPEQQLGRVVVEPRGRIERGHEFVSGTLALGVVRGTQLVDATVSIRGADGKEVAAGRTYTAATSNPRSWVLPPGEYAVQVREIRGVQRDLKITVPPRGTTERTVDLAAE